MGRKNATWPTYVSPHHTHRQTDRQVSGQEGLQRLALPCVSQSSVDGNQRKEPSKRQHNTTQHPCWLDMGVPSLVYTHDSFDLLCLRWQADPHSPRPPTDSPTLSHSLTHQSVSRAIGHRQIQSASQTIVCVCGTTKGIRHLSHHAQAGRQAGGPYVILISRPLTHDSSVSLWAPLLYLLCHGHLLLLGHLYTHRHTHTHTHTWMDGWMCVCVFYIYTRCGAISSLCLAMYCSISSTSS